MNKILITITLVSVLTIIGLLFYIDWDKDKKPQPELFPTKTDTVYINRPIQALKPYKKPVLPSVVTEYLFVESEDISKLESLKLRILNDSLVIEDLKTKITIHENYIKQFPINPKLVSLSLDKNNLSLSLLEIDGVAKSYDYPISTDYYKYRWSDKVFSAEKSVSPTVRNRLNYYMGINSTFYGVITPSATFRIEKRWARNIISVNSSMELLEIKVPTITMNYEYNLRNGK